MAQLQRGMARAGGSLLVAVTLWLVATTVADGQVVSLARHAGRRVGHLAPGLYDDHPPLGRVAADDLLSHLTDARGTVILIHGGGWLLHGPLTVRSTDPEAAWLRAHGFQTDQIDYRPGLDSLADVVATYDALRARLGARADICAYGVSAGGQLVQLLAASRPSLDCVISEGGIEDLRSVPHQCAYGHACGALDDDVHAAFDDHLWEFSPVRLASRITQPFLAGGSSCDPLVDEPAQLGEMRRVRPATETLLLDGVPDTGAFTRTNFVHASVTPAALRHWHAAEARTLARSLRPRARLPGPSIASGGDDRVRLRRDPARGVPRLRTSRDRARRRA